MRSTPLNERTYILRWKMASFGKMSQYGNLMELDGLSGFLGILRLLICKILNYSQETVSLALRVTKSTHQHL